MFNVFKDGYTYIGAPNCLVDDDDDDFINYMKTSLRIKQYVGPLEKGLKIMHRDCFGKFTHEITIIDDYEFIRNHNHYLKKQERES